MREGRGGRNARRPGASGAPQLGPLSSGPLGLGLLPPGCSRPSGRCQAAPPANPPVAPSPKLAPRQKRSHDRGQTIYYSYIPKTHYE